MSIPTKWGIGDDWGLPPEIVEGIRSKCFNELGKKIGGLFPRLEASIQDCTATWQTEKIIPGELINYGYEVAMTYSNLVVPVILKRAPEKIDSIGIFILEELIPFAYKDYNEKPIYGIQIDFQEAKPAAFLAFQTLLSATKEQGFCEKEAEAKNKQEKRRERFVNALISFGTAVITSVAIYYVMEALKG